MPLKQCQINGKSGWKWGNEGTCYTGPNGKRSAIAQAIAIISAKPKDIANLAANKVSVDYDDTASTAKGKELLKRLLSEGKDVCIISARGDKKTIVNALKDYLPASKIYATGSNKAKVEKIKSLNIGTHYDNNKNVINDVNKLTNAKGILFNG
jgi:hypothetical protein